MKTQLHGVVGFLGMMIIITFFTSSVMVELLGDEQAIAWVKQMIVYGLLVLVPAMMITGISGKVIVGARQGRLIKTKTKRMQMIAFNGVVILVPCAIILNNLAISGKFDAMFYGIQMIELFAGAINITLMGLNMWDGLRLTGRLKNL